MAWTTDLRLRELAILSSGLKGNGFEEHSILASSSKLLVLGNDDDDHYLTMMIQSLRVVWYQL